MQRTKIIATLGPASHDLETIRKLIRAGASCFRINFSHGDGPSQQKIIDLAREAGNLEGKFIPILADIQGPKLRVGKLPKEGVTLTEGDEFIITGRKIEGSSREVHSPYEYLAKDVSKGTKILLADGTLELIVENISGGDVYTKVLIGGRLYSNKGMNIPNTKLSVETLTGKDKRDLDFISRADIDLVAISFVRKAEDLALARKYLNFRRKPILAKLEVTEALDNLDEIIESSDGVMVARGDLGVELPFEQVPALQKRILERAVIRGKWAMVATQMLGSMVLNSRPSRAEVSDVANAVLDGADALMLSEETATGSHPVGAVEAMSRIAAEAENLRYLNNTKIDPDISSFAAGAAGAAVNAAERLHARAIVSLAGSGLTTLLLSKWRPAMPIIGLGSYLPTLRRLNVLRGVIPLKIGKESNMEEQLLAVDDYLLENGLASPGETVVAIGVTPSDQNKDPNTIRFHRVRE